MKSLPTLLKLAQRQLDEIGRDLAAQARMVGKLSERKTGLVGRLLHEVQAAQANPAFLPALPAFRARIQGEINTVEARIGAEQAVHARIRERLMGAYQEKARLEQLIEQQARRKAAAEAARDQAALDETALNLAVRRQA